MLTVLRKYLDLITNLENRQLVYALSLVFSGQWTPNYWYVHINIIWKVLNILLGFTSQGNEMNVHWKSKFIISKEIDYKDKRFVYFILLTLDAEYIDLTGQFHKLFSDQTDGVERDLVMGLNLPSVVYLYNII